MKNDERFYDKRLSSLFTFRTFFGCWQNTFQTPSFNANFLLFLYIFTSSSFLLENDYERCTHSTYKFTIDLFKYRLFQKLSKDFGFHRNQCKMQIMYGNAHDNRCICFQNRFHLFIVHASFFHFSSCLFAKIVFFAVQITKGKFKFGTLKIWSYVILYPP